MSFLLDQRARRVKEYVESFGLTAPVPQDKPLDTLTSAWRVYWVNSCVPRDKKLRPLQAMRDVSLTRYHSFLEILPQNNYTKFTDDEFRFAVLHRLRLLTPFPVKCSNSETPPELMRRLSAAEISRTEFTGHLQSCCSCAKFLFSRRHEAVVGAIKRVCKFHGYDCRVLSHQQRTLTLPGNARGGADILLYHNGTTYAMDATVVKETSPSETTKNAMTKAFRKKMQQYEEYAKKTKHVVLPFVMSVYGLIAPETLNALRPIFRVHRTDVDFRSDVLSIPQCCMLKATSAAIMEIESMNKLNGMPISIPIFTPSPPTPHP
ncbi:MAG: hypothetical protein HC927_04650 [Deltaproteobacteria bacterium]|nr:hypothetical protein [Deltaproteobacteria bacterium]